MRNFSNKAVETELALLADATTNTFTLRETLGHPTAPYTLIVAPDSGAEEIVLVSALVNNVATVVRGWGGTTAVEHPAGTKVRHGAVAEDFREAALAYRQLFGEPQYDPSNPSLPPTNPPLVDMTDVVRKSTNTWADLLPADYVSPIPQTGGTP